MNIHFPQAIPPKHNSTLTSLPSIKGRYIVLDTETTGLDPSTNNIIEIAAIEIQNGRITGNQFHLFINPRYRISQSAESKHKMSQSFYTSFYSNVYPSEQHSLRMFIKFIHNSLIFAHNAIFDMNFINNELQYRNLPIINKKRFRCTMKLFKQMVEPYSSKQNYSLEYCCNYFKLNSQRENFHSAIFDAFMTGRLVCALFRYRASYNVTKVNVVNVVEESNSNSNKDNDGFMVDTGELEKLIEKEEALNYKSDSGTKDSSEDSAGKGKVWKDRERRVGITQCDFDVDGDVGFIRRKRIKCDSDSGGNRRDCDGNGNGNGKEDEPLTLNEVVIKEMFCEL